MLYRLEAGPRPGLEDVQGRKVAGRIRAALGLVVGQVRLVKVFTADGLDEAQARRLLEDGVWHDVQIRSLRPKNKNLQSEVFIF